jgi:serine protease Do
MNKRNLLTIGGAAALGLALIALPASSASPQKPDDSAIARLQHRIDELEARLQAQLESRQDQQVVHADGDALEDSARTFVVENQDPMRIEVLPNIETDDANIVIGDEGPSWLGVETNEVTADKAKELKLSAERGVVLGKIVPDSPAAKAGLKENDVVTEVNGQRVEGAAQFRRMIHEIPAGRSIQLTVWRDGRAQTISATLGKSEERHRAMRPMIAPTPGTFAFRMPEMPDIPSMEWNGNMLFGGGQPRIGIDAEDVSGQLGAFFGAPEGEGILVRDVNSGSPAEKAGVKAGDVITSLNGERIRTVGELREKLSAKGDKDHTVKLGVLRNKSEISLSVELPAPPARTKHLMSHRTSI